MCEDKTPEVELQDKPGMSNTVNGLVSETAKLFGAMSTVLLTTVEDLSNVVVIKVDGETRENLDLLVEVGAAKSRREAAVSLLREGITAQHATLERVRRTKAQISELRQQMRSLVEVHGT